MLLFGVGISLVVAPLTTTLMSSVPVSNAGLASAINNAMSRVGQPLLSALIFVAGLGLVLRGAGGVPCRASTRLTRRCGPPSSRSTRPQPEHRRRGRRAAAIEASVDAMHLAALVCALLLLGGSLVNWVGLRPRPGDD